MPAAASRDIRYISVIAGCLCVPLAWLVARHIAGDFAGACAAVLVAISPQNIAVSQYARAYALLILCIICALLCVLRSRQLALAEPPTDRARRFWLLVYGEAHQSDAIAKEIEASSARVLHRRTEKLDLSLFAANSP
jgi:dolichyl-phosphate-mannose--protein O-mannosyl transferase